MDTFDQTYVHVHQLTKSYGRHDGARRRRRSNSAPA